MEINFHNHKTYFKKWKIKKKFRNQSIEVEQATTKKKWVKPEMTVMNIVNINAIGGDFNGLGLS